MKNQEYIESNKYNKGSMSSMPEKHSMMNSQSSNMGFNQQSTLKGSSSIQTGINPGLMCGQQRASKLGQNKGSEIQDLNQELQKELKRRGDTAVHQAALDGDAPLLKDLVRKGMPVFNPSDADGGTPLHRAAECGSIECAQILLDKNADIDAPNFMGQTPFHVCGERMDFVFAKFLLKNRAKRNCRPGCLKCRSFLKQMERHDKTQKDLEQLAKEAKLEEEKVQQQKKKERKRIRRENKELAPEIDFLEELERVKEECGGGPFFSKKENKIYKEEQERLRLEEDMRQQESKYKKMIPQQNTQSGSNILGELMDLPHIAKLLTNALRASGAQINEAQDCQDMSVAVKEQKKPKKNNKNKKKGANLATSQTKEMIKIQEQSSLQITQNETLKSLTPFSNTLQPTDLAKHLETLTLTDEEKVLVAQPPLYLNNVQNYPPDSDPILMFGSWKKRQKRLEELEEEKKKTLTHSADSLNCSSDGEIPFHGYN